MMDGINVNEKYRLQTTIVLTVIFTMPFASGSLWFVLYGFAFLTLFPLSVFLMTRKEGFATLVSLKNFYPVRFYLLVCFAVSSVISYLWVVFSDVVVEQKVLATIRYFAYWLLAFYSFMLYRLMVLTKLSPLTINIYFSLGTLVLIAQLVSIYVFFDAPNAENWGLNPPVGVHVRVMGSIASISLISVAIILWLQKNSVIKQLLLYVSLFLISGFLVWTGSRMSMLACLVVLLAFAGFSLFWGKISLLKLAGVFLTVILSVIPAERLAIYDWSGLNRAVRVTMVPTVDSENGVEAFADQVASGRIAIWSAAINGAIKSPLFGLGPYGYFFIKERPPLYDHSHNILIELFVEWGVVGAFMFIGVLITFAWQIIRNLKEAFIRRDAAWLSAAAVLIVLNLNAMVDGIYFNFTTAVALATFYVILVVKTSNLNH